MQNDYDALARIYDPLSRLVFFRSQINAQRGLIPFIPKNSHILIVGGGTGWILESIAAHHPEGLCITYVELSKKMLAIAQKRNWRENEVRFIQAPIESYASSHQFDVVVTGFVFDNFIPRKASFVFLQLDGFLKKQGYWLFADFVYDKKTGKKWQAFLLELMYWFFRKTCNIEASTLTDIEPSFSENSYTKEWETFHYRKFIRAAVYRKE